MSNVTEVLSKRQDQGLKPALTLGASCVFKILIDRKDEGTNWPELQCAGAMVHKEPLCVSDLWWL